MSLMPWARALRSAAAASEPEPWPSPAVMMIAAAAPFAPAAATMSGTVVGGVVMITTSGAQPISPTEPIVDMPSISR